MNLAQQRNQPLRCRLHHLCAALCGGGSCVACGTCIGECPTEAISAGDIYVIDPDKCIDCGTCAGVCPSEAIIEG